jgi:hypothetical protein
VEPDGSVDTPGDQRQIRGVRQDVPGSVIEAHHQGAEQRRDPVWPEVPGTEQLGTEALGQVSEIVVPVEAAGHGRGDDMGEALVPDAPGQSRRHELGPTHRPAVRAPNQDTSSGREHDVAAVLGGHARQGGPVIRCHPASREADDGVGRWIGHGLPA